MDVVGLNLRFQWSDFGWRLDVNINAALYFNGVFFVGLTYEPVETSFYRVGYDIPRGASAGEYVLVEEVKYCGLYAAAIRDFLASGWLNGVILEINCDTGGVKDSIYEIRLNLMEINVIGANVTAIKGTVVDIEIALEECEDVYRMASRNSNRDLIAACILSAMTAIAAVVLLRKSLYHLNILFLLFEQTSPKSALNSRSRVRTEHNFRASHIQIWLSNDFSLKMFFRHTAKSFSSVQTINKGLLEGLTSKKEKRSK